MAPLATATPQATPGVSASERPLASPPTSAPAIIVPDDRLLTTSPITLRVTVPEPGTTMSGLVVRVYRNSRLLTTRKVAKVGRMRVPDVPLRRGSNKLTATIANSGGEGPRSASVTLTLDDQAPKITVKSPRTDTLIDASQITVTGRTGAGLAVTGRTSPSNKKVRAVADQNGRYTLLDMPLAQGRNLITVVSRDAAGNPGTASVVVVRGDGHLAARLKLSRDKLRIKVLPKTMDADVTVLDANGLPVDGATVEFSIVPHGQLTRTHITTTEQGWHRELVTHPPPQVRRHGRAGVRHGQGHGSRREHDLQARPLRVQVVRSPPRPCVRPSTGYPGQARKGRPRGPDGTILRRIGRPRLSSGAVRSGGGRLRWGGDRRVYRQGPGPRSGGGLLDRRGLWEQIGISLVGRERQLPEQALEGRNAIGRLPAGTNLVALERRPAPVQGAVPKPPRDGTPEVAAAATRDGVAGTCPAPDRVGLGRAAMGTAPCLHVSKCSCTNDMRPVQPASVDHGPDRRPDQPG